MNLVKWGRSGEGFVDSKCGRWKIVPLYCGCVRPQFYEVHDHNKRRGGWHDTQAEAKLYVDTVVRKERDLR